ncbi:hypothetical protein D3C76_1877840 [compost metagenome]
MDRAELSSFGSTVAAPARRITSPALWAWARGDAMARASREAVRRCLRMDGSNRF